MNTLISGIRGLQHGWYGDVVVVAIEVDRCLHACQQQVVSVNVNGSLVQSRSLVRSVPSQYWPMLPSAKKKMWNVPAPDYHF